MATRERPSKLRWLAVLMAVAVLGCDPAAETDAGAPDSGFDAGGGDASACPPLQLLPSEHSFGSVATGTSSAAVDFLVRNDCGSPTGALSVTIGGGDAGEFDLTSSTCVGAPLAAGAMCTVSVRFSPSALGAKTATLTVTDGRVAIIATLSGNGAMDAGLRITPTPRDFGSTMVGTATAPTTFTVENTSADLPSGALTIMVGGADVSQFMLGVDNCTGMVLAGGASCTVEGIYNPTMRAAHAATIEASASPGGAAVASVSGSSYTTEGISPVPGFQDFGSVVTGGSSATVDFTLRNVGGAPTGTISHSFGGADASEFSVTASSCAGAPLAAGAMCTITVRFNAGVVGAKFATLDITDGTASGMASLSATSIADAGLIITPSTHAFGSSPIGTATGGFTFTVTNTGGAATGPLTVALAGANPADFRPTAGGDSCTSTVLPASGTCTIAVQFSPTASGARASTLRVAGTPGGMATASLTGTGI